MRPSAPAILLAALHCATASECSSAHTAHSAERPACFHRSRGTRTLPVPASAGHTQTQSNNEGTALGRSARRLTAGQGSTEATLHASQAVGPPLNRTGARLCRIAMLPFGRPDNRENTVRPAPALHFATENLGTKSNS